MHDFPYNPEDIKAAREMVNFIRFYKKTPENESIFESKFRPFLNKLMERFKQHDDDEMKVYYLIMLGALGNEPKDAPWLKRVKR